MNKLHHRVIPNSHETAFPHTCLLKALLAIGSGIQPSLFFPDYLRVFSGPGGCFGSFITSPLISPKTPLCGLHTTLGVGCWIRPTLCLFSVFLCVSRCRRKPWRACKGTDFPAFYKRRGSYLSKGCTLSSQPAHRHTRVAHMARPLSRPGPTARDLNTQSS
ncbi:hypothetical protein IGI04_042653 [Brassica rapa subsp. trilocularis]|uniref:Uncharacterized protein n=1 Tax=Brassica rapa subsp. trilocularis TaxID=1813537 RepID=A0ABQ7KHS5_BRACM|nr:hypothetical protein IGI04_042653 [Brassica rapa subsp. trilocularis]